MTIMEVINFLNKDCKNQKHFLCTGSWQGFNFVFYCECECHIKKNDVADGFQRPDSATSATLTHSLLEVTN